MQLILVQRISKLERVILILSRITSRNMLRRRITEVLSWSDNIISPLRARKSSLSRSIKLLHWHQHMHMSQWPGLPWTSISLSCLVAPLIALMKDKLPLRVMLLFWAFRPLPLLIRCLGRVVMGEHLCLFLLGLELDWHWLGCVPLEL